jgi:CheY-like chemotaxis protein
MSGPLARILVVDDEPIVGDTMRLLLAPYGIEVSSVESAFAGLQAFKSKMFNMAIVDEMMPGSKGHELATCLKGYEPSFPILMISAFPMGKFNGIDDFLLKPVVPEALYQFVARLLNIEMPVLTTA